jgi:flagellar hook protein FlgE
MMRSLFAGVSGLKNHQTRMDVIGNNIANVNTIGFKKGRVVFQDMLSQTLRSAASSSTNRGGTNPIQVGLGMSLASIDVIHTTGSFQPTGKNTDLSIEGEGFFMVGEGKNIFYTRAGNFELDLNNVFIHGGTGLIAQGILADSTGKINPKGQIEDINLAAQVSSPSRATTEINFAKNLDFRAELQEVIENVSHENGVSTEIDLIPPLNKIVVKDASGNLLVENDPAGFSVDYSTGKLTIEAAAESKDYTISYYEPNYSTSVSIFDSKGNTHLVNVCYTKIADNEWAVNTSVDDVFPSNGSGQGTLEFDPITGELLNSTVSNVVYDVNGAASLDFALNFENITEYAGDFTITYTGQDGYEAGYLEEVSVDSNGVLNGSFSNGQSRALAQLTIATFSNPAGLTKAGNNLYTISNNSGVPDQGIPGISGRGIIKPETLEMSNVDLTQEFVDMIVTQRGFQANSRVITTSDQILEELVNLRR